MVDGSDAAKGSVNGSTAPSYVNGDSPIAHRLRMERKASSPMAPAFMVSAPGKVILCGEHSVVHGKVRLLWSHLPRQASYTSDPFCDRLLLLLLFPCDPTSMLRPCPSPSEQSLFVSPISILYTPGTSTIFPGPSSTLPRRRNHTTPLSPNLTPTSSKPCSHTSAP